jgi:hypothetical protein
MLRLRFKLYRPRKTCLPESVRKEIQKLYTKEKHHKASWYIFSLLSDKFKDFKVDNTIFEKAILSKNTVLEIRSNRYLNRKNSAPARSAKHIMQN